LLSGNAACSECKKEAALNGKMRLRLRRRTSFKNNHL